MNKLAFLSQHKLVRNLRRILNFVKCALKKQKSGQKRQEKRLSSPSSPAQTVRYVDNPESDDNCRRLTKKSPHKVCQLLHNRDILGSQILGQISALMRCVKLKAKRQKNKNMT